MNLVGDQICVDCLQVCQVTPVICYQISGMSFDLLVVRYKQVEGTPAEMSGFFFTMPSLKYTKEVLQTIIPQCTSFRNMAIKLGLCGHGGSVDGLKRKTIKYGLDYSHFAKRKAWNKGSTSPYKKNANEILKKGYVQQAKRLRRALLEIGIQHKCSICGITKWMDKDIVLQIDHIDGDKSNNQYDNLRFLCPNCHSQTNTFCFIGRKHKHNGGVAESGLRRLT